MICATCGTTNPSGIRFCEECGTRLAIACTSCGAPVSTGAKFCGTCGTATVVSTASGGASGPAGPAPSVTVVGSVAPVAERRLVSVLFADLVGFTPFAEERDAEEVRETLTRYFDLATDVVTRYGGMVEKFIGDAVMAVWGTPTAHEDDAGRAVRAALDLVDAVRALGPTVQARAGVLTGEAAVTIGATNQGMVAGDLVNTAARLQSVAPPGAVLVGETTHRSASKAIAFEEAGDQLLKGKTSPVPAWRALRIVAERGGRGRAESFEAPFVGRTDELRLLKDLFHSTSRERRSRLVSIIGPAGIGKTRLAWEFLKYLDGLVERVWFHDGRSPAYGDGISFWALGEMVRRRAGLFETDDEATTRSKVAAMLAEHVPDADERRWIEPALLALLGIDSGIGSEQLFGAWRTFFERLAETAPVVLVFEDFHFADSGLIDFVDHLLEWSRGAPIYVVTLARPELVEKRADWGAGKRNFVSIFLEPLAEGEMRALLAGLVPGLPEPAIRAIVARADGIPLYAVETVRMLLAEERLALEGDVYVPIGDLTALAVPETLTALIASRLDALTAEARAIVQDAAVVGQSFTLDGLAAVSGVDVATLEPTLRTLVRRELFSLDADPRSPEHGQYSFVQALIREVAYGTLAKRDRKVRHLAAARFFEGLGSDELAGALAGHYLAAHANSAPGPEADALARQARLALRGAAARAAALGAHDQAVALLRQALTVTSDAAEQAELHERAGESATFAGHYDVADSHLRSAVALRRAGDDRSAIAQATTKLGWSLTVARKPAEAIEILERASEELSDLASEPVVVALSGQLARTLYVGDSDRALGILETVLAAAEHAVLVPLIADSLTSKGSLLSTLGRTVEGLALMRAGQELAEANGLLLTVARALGNRANFEPQPRAAFEIARDGVAIARRLGIRRMEITAVGNGSETAVRLGEWDWVANEGTALLGAQLDLPDRISLLTAVIIPVRLYRGEPVADWLEEVERAGAAASESEPLGAFAIGQFVAGRFAEAIDTWFRQAHIDPLNAPYVLAMAARAALWSRDPARAREAIEGLEATGLHRPEVDADRVSLRAGMAALEGDTADALVRYRAALATWRSLGLVWDEALCGIDMATLLDPGEPDVRAAADASRAILTRLGARPFVDRLEAAMLREVATGAHSTTPDAARSATQAASPAPG